MPNIDYFIGFKNQDFFEKVGYFVNTPISCFPSSLRVPLYWVKEDDKITQLHTLKGSRYSIRSDREELIYKTFHIGVIFLVFYYIHHDFSKHLFESKKYQMITTLFVGTITYSSLEVVAQFFCFFSSTYKSHICEIEKVESLTNRQLFNRFSSGVFQTIEFQNENFKYRKLNGKFNKNNALFTNFKKDIFTIVFLDNIDRFKFNFCADIQGILQNDSIFIRVNEKEDDNWYTFTLHLKLQDKNINTWKVIDQRMSQLQEQNVKISRNIHNLFDNSLSNFMQGSLIQGTILEICSKEEWEKNHSSKYQQMQFNDCLSSYKYMRKNSLDFLEIEFHINCPEKNVESFTPFVIKILLWNASNFLKDEGVYLKIIDEFNGENFIFSTLLYIYNGQIGHQYFEYTETNIKEKKLILSEYSKDALFDLKNSIDEKVRDDELIPTASSTQTAEVTQDEIIDVALIELVEQLNRYIERQLVLGIEIKLENFDYLAFATQIEQLPFDHYLLGFQLPFAQFFLLTGKSDKFNEIYKKIKSDAFVLPLFLQYLNLKKLRKQNPEILTQLCQDFPITDKKIKNTIKTFDSTLSEENTQYCKAILLELENNLGN